MYYFIYVLWFVFPVIVNQSRYISGSSVFEGVTKNSVHGTLMLHSNETSIS
jgi:hypothetical protein